MKNLMGENVYHKIFAHGTVLSNDENSIFVKFERGVKEINLRHCLKQGIIKFENSKIGDELLNYFQQSELFYQKMLDEKVNKLNSKKIISLPKHTKTDFSHIVCGRTYGTNSREIYEKFCDALGWDKNKSGCFGWQTPLYAENADADRTRDVWFICYPNYDVEKHECVADNCNALNLIVNNGDKIIEVVDEHIGKSNDADRITFVKTKKGYTFFGVYKILQNGTTRIYRRVSADYPII